MWLVVMTDILVCAHKYILHPHHHDLSFPMHVCHVKRKKSFFLYSAADGFCVAFLMLKCVV